MTRPSPATSPPSTAAEPRNGLRAFWFGRSQEPAALPAGGSDDPAYPRLDDRRPLGTLGGRLVLRDDVRPPWLESEAVAFLPVPFFELEPAGEALAWLEAEGARRPAVVRVDGSTVWGFDPDLQVQTMLTSRAYLERRPIYTRLPFHYHVIPPQLRALARWLLAQRQRRRLETGDRFPRWPVEESVETLRHLYLRATGADPLPIWPEGTRYAVSLSHDVDSAFGQALVPRVAEIERAAGLRSAFYFVGKRYEIDHALLDGLRRDGFEAGLHGYTHDNKMPFMRPEAIGRRLDECRDLIDRHAMRGFRSPMMMRTPALHRSLSARFAYDSSVPDTSMFPAAGNGSGSVFPSYLDGTLVLPLTVPPDGALLSLGATPESIVERWMEKIAWIKAVGGHAFILTHPERGFTATPEMLGAYARLLQRLAADASAWHALPMDVAALWRARVSPGRQPVRKEQYRRIFELEERFWWHVGLRDLVRRMLPRGRRLRVLDAGCGNGMLLKELLGDHDAFGFDYAPEAIGFARERGLTRLARASIQAVPFRDETFDAVISLDVLYHRAITDEAAAFDELVRILRPGGLLILNLPAFEALRSPHDEVAMTRHRYTRGEVAALAARRGLVELRNTYRVTITFPAAALARLAARFRRVEGEPQTDLRPLPSSVNAVLTRSLLAENALIERVNLPLGLSVFSVFRKPPAIGSAQ